MSIKTFCIAAVLTASVFALSSFRGEEPKPKKKATTEAQKKVAAKKLATQIELFFGPTEVWSREDHGLPCGGSSKFCKLTITRADGQNITETDQNLINGVTAVYNPATNTPGLIQITVNGILYNVLVEERNP